MERELSKERDLSKYEYSLRFRFLDSDGFPTTMRWRFFRDARSAIEFLNRLDNVDSRQPTNVTISRREVGPWTYVNRFSLEEAAAEEGGGR